MQKLRRSTRTLPASSTSSLRYSIQRRTKSSFTTRRGWSRRPNKPRNHTRYVFPDEYGTYRHFGCIRASMLQSETTPTSFSFIPVEPSSSHALLSLPLLCPDSLLPILLVPSPKFHLKSLSRSYPYTMHKFHDFKPKSHIHITHSHSLKHQHFCKERLCPSHYPYGC
jgi:hypothetical protein